MGRCHGTGGDGGALCREREDRKFPAEATCVRNKQEKNRRTGVSKSFFLLESRVLYDIPPIRDRARRHLQCLV